PGTVATSGAEDVMIADLDDDDNPDLVFANWWDNGLDHHIDSYVFLLDGSRGLPSAPSARLPTTGATGVAAADLDGTGLMDLIFSSGYNGTTYAVESVVYLGGVSSWPSTPDIELPTEGAQDVAVAMLVEPGAGGYLSMPIVPEDDRNTGTYHTFRYTAGLGASQTCTLRIVDPDTWETLAETTAMAGTHEWDLQGLWRIKDHPRVRVMAVFGGLDTPGDAYLADLWLNWTLRLKVPPQIQDVGLGADEGYRGERIPLWVNVSDEYDLPGELDVIVEHRLNGTSAWASHLISDLTFRDGSWRAEFVMLLDATVGVYDLRVTVTDTDGLYTPWFERPSAIEVLNNLPTAPVVAIDPAEPLSTSTMMVTIVQKASDAESPGLVYHYRWFRDGEPMATLTTDSVPYFNTKKGENWSVEVRAFDGLDEGPPALAWAIVRNAPPLVKDDLPDPEFEEDTVDTEWLDLSNAFMDPDGDTLTWTLAEEPVNLVVEIDPVTGSVTLTPAENWFGEENLTFLASDGELQVSQRVTVTVTSVNDIPWIATVDGKVVTGGTLEYTIKQGDELVITYTLADVEGDQLTASVTSLAVDHDEAAGTITFAPQNNEVGTLTFTLRVNDVVSPDQKVTLDFVIVVENENDPMDDPRITSPANNSRFKVNQSFSLIAICTDPDIQFGQVLNFSWSSNISGFLGYESSLVVRLADPGTHLITLTVRDPDFTKTVTLVVVVERQGGTG
ncbi:MAG: hypothetical protein GWN18_20130, partial [Thermoplasmata archaeon]|nr:hypothetical protein [Thermoplasmata archaeon]NIS14434.1 hypothetical protein [Thermoplasmata archaeon]NIS22284.1 hypothetical protein [Thermoplasmata archaeon]NIT77691.1 hypothetical protein [Thermoplasmata archaeon]NIU51289.1 hypothetical protein [Thermoplasmata archaeon]